MGEQRPPGGGRADTLAAAGQERSAEAVLHSLDPGRGGGERQMGPLRPVGDRARLHHMPEQAEIHEIEADHGGAAVRTG